MTDKAPIEAKATVMDELEMRIVLNKASWQSPSLPFAYHLAIANAQAGISYQAGLEKERERIIGIINDLSSIGYSHGADYKVAILKALKGMK